MMCNLCNKEEGDLGVWHSETEIEVRYAETDQMGIVYHANYLVWFEIGRTKLVEALGFRYANMEEQGYISPVLDVQAKFHRPIRYGERARVKTWIEDYDGLKTVYGYEITNQEGDVCVTGSSSHVVLKKDTFHPVSMRRAFPDWHKVYLEHSRKRTQETE